MRILIVEDDPKIAATLQKGLEENALQTDWASTVADAVTRFEATRHDLVVLDLGLPDGHGLDVLAAIRREQPSTPVLILTACDELDDRVRGLDAGADDYLAKPFAFTELMARIRALLRRASGDAVRFQVADLAIDLLARKATRGDRELDLRPREFDLLAFLARHADSVVARDVLAREVWGVQSQATVMDNVINVHISHLRNKIDYEVEPKLLHTVRGIGFRLGDQP